MVTEAFEQGVYSDKPSSPNSLKQANITPVHNKMTRMIKTTIDQSAYYFISKSVCKISFMLPLILFFFRPSIALEQDTVLSIQLLDWFKNGDVTWIKVAKYKEKDFGCLVLIFLLLNRETYGFTYENLRPNYSNLTDRKHKSIERK